VERESVEPFDRFAETVADFERTVLGQRPFEPSHYDVDYFAESWRADDNRYDLDTRREIEGPQPALIREVFEPTSVLDVGCGPGFLMQFVHELGVDVHGVDFSPASLELAPPAMRERIAIGPVEALDAEDESYDLVLCREVLEHLTVVQVRRTVAEICRVSSRFAYVTTRFHPEPATLLDVTTDFETDPTHITLLAKDFVRTLFVLEGFRSRPDLERRLDWAGKGRVLVYERAANGSGEGPRYHRAP
jgi:2-polyprenyl-3-methyl-5-hydroxy-6-metoxy-1,4-benzoquinol methylase